jgi:hypothetical protein
MAIVSGVITGLILRLPIMQQIRKEEELFEDSQFWEIPEEAHVEVKKKEKKRREVTNL